MGKILRILITALVLVVVLVAAADRGAVASREPTLVVLGDSLSAAYGIARENGWVTLLAQRLQAKNYPHKVINESISGDTTANGLTRLRSIIARQKVGVLIVELGANDGLRGYPVSQMRENLRRIIRLGREAGAEVLLVGITIPNNYGRRYKEAFEAVYEELATAEAVPVVCSLVEGVPLQQEYFQDDELHPSALAQPILLENVWRKLEPILKAGY